MTQAASLDLPEQQGSDVFQTIGSRLDRREQLVGFEQRLGTDRHEITDGPALVWVSPTVPGPAVRSASVIRYPSWSGLHRVIRGKVGRSCTRASI